MGFSALFCHRLQWFFPVRQSWMELLIKKICECITEYLTALCCGVYHIFVSFCKESWFNVYDSWIVFTGITRSFRFSKIIDIELTNNMFIYLNLIMIADSNRKCVFVPCFVCLTVSQQFACSKSSAIIHIHVMKIYPGISSLLTSYCSIVYGN